MPDYKPQFDEDTDRMGSVTLIRLEDKKTVFLQTGDDADGFLNQQAQLLNFNYPHGPFPCYEAHLDVIIGQYFTED